MSIGRVPTFRKFFGVGRSDPWKEDGNIIICAQEKSYFRVHRSVLSSYSKVFKDMFDCPHSDEAEEESIEHCPVVQLHDDSTDVQMMLKALYNRRWADHAYLNGDYPLPHHEDKRVPFPHIAAFLRLGEKYNIPVLVEEAKAKLLCFSDPTSVLTFEKLKEVPLSQSTTLFPGIADADPHKFKIMNLLQEVGFKVPLPLAMYHCMVYCPSTIIVDGYKSNGTVYTLSRTNVRAYIFMKQTFDNFRIQIALGMHRSTSCTRQGCEIKMRGEWVKKAINSPPFCHWDDEWKELLCEACRKYLEHKRKNALDEVWGKLPLAFGFKTWEQTKKRGDLST